MRWRPVLYIGTRCVCVCVCVGDSVDRSALWEALVKIGCPPGFVTIIRSFHEGMKASVIENGERSDSRDFDVSNGTKQGCVLAPLLFIIFFSLMLRVASGLQ